MKARNVLFALLKSIPNRLYTRCFLFIISLPIYANALSQNNYDWRTKIDLIVQRTDSLSLKSQQTFHLSRILRNDKTFRNDEIINETWYYTLNQGKVIIFQIRYVIDSSEFIESYYVNNGRVICMEEYESEYFTYDDTIKWGKVLFFDNNALKLHVTVGKRKYGNRDWNLQGESLELFSKRYSQLQKNLK